LSNVTVAFDVLLCCCDTCPSISDVQKVRRVACLGSGCEKCLVFSVRLVLPYPAHDHFCNHGPPCRLFFSQGFATEPWLCLVALAAGPSPMKVDAGCANCCWPSNANRSCHHASIGLGAFHSPVHRYLMIESLAQSVQCVQLSSTCTCGPGEDVKDGQAMGI